MNVPASFLLRLSLLQPRKVVVMMALDCIFYLHPSRCLLCGNSDAGLAKTKQQTSQNSELQRQITWPPNTGEGRDTALALAPFAFLFLFVIIFLSGYCCPLLFSPLFSTNRHSQGFSGMQPCLSCASVFFSLSLPADSCKLSAPCEKKKESKCSGRF